MKLSRAERWMLANQFKILEKLYPEDADHYRTSREVLESGFELEYAWAVENILDEKRCLTTEECHEVYDILSMYQDLKQSYDALDDKSMFEEATIRFRGFDGNSEGSRLGYCRFICDPKEGRFSELHRGDKFNSHMPMMDAYRRMLDVWRPIYKRRGIGDDGTLTKDEMFLILSERPHPESPTGQLIRAKPEGSVQ